MDIDPFHGLTKVCRGLDAVIVGHMGIRTRKLVGTVALVVFLIVYSLVAMSLAAGRITEAAQPFQALYYLVAGLLWVLPAGVLVRWMQRPDPD